MNLETEHGLSETETDTEIQVPMRLTPRSSQMMMTTRVSEDVTILEAGCVESWDGADLCLLRDAFNQLIVKERRRLIGLDMMHVKHLPTGFFGMLYDWYERGVLIRLYFPQPHVQQMLWFRQFFVRADSPGVEDPPPPATVFCMPAQVDQSERRSSLEPRAGERR